MLIWIPVWAILITGCTTGIKDKKSEDQIEVVKVKVLKIGDRPEIVNHSYIATIEESVSIPLSFLAAGTVEQVLVSEGQSIHKGQLLAELNSENYKNAYQIALSKENQARDAFNRLEPVYKNGSLPEIKFIEVQTGVEMAKSAVLISKKNFDDCKLYAPTSGIIGRRFLEPGMSILPGTPVFQLVKIEKVNVNVPIPENEIATIKKGQKAQVIVTALGGQQFGGEVTEVGILSNPLSHTYMVKIGINNLDKNLRPGMVCQVLINNFKKDNQIIIPPAAIQTDGFGAKYVFTANPSTLKAIKKAITVGAINQNGITISSGLMFNDLLIIEGFQKISENSTIQIIK